MRSDLPSTAPPDREAVPRIFFPSAPTSEIRAQIFRYLPAGRELPEPQWAARHRVILWIVWAHVLGLVLFGLYQGWDPLYSFGEPALVGLAALVASWSRLGRRFRSATAAFGLVTSSAILTQFSGGYIEAHFHYFVVVAIIALYADWVPFLLAMLYVALDHGVIGSLRPEWVYNHADAIAYPWKWALLHAVLVLGECAALVVLWNSEEEASNRAEHVLRSVGEAIVEVDTGGRIVSANPAFTQLTGRPHDGVVGRPLLDFLDDSHEAERPARVTLVGLVEPASARRHFESKLRSAQAESVPVDIVATPLIKGGQSLGSVFTLTDLTERKRSEELRRATVRAQLEMGHLKDMNALKTQLLNTASHELNTPLTPIKLQLHLLKRGDPKNVQERNKVVGVLERNIDRLSHLVQDILDAARLRANSLAVRHEPVDLSLLLSDSVESFKEVARQASVNLDAEVPKGLWVDGDAHRLGQVFFNLLDNAIKFSKAGDTVQVRVAVLEHRVLIHVTDTGQGFSVEDGKRLFQPFVQVHDTMQITRSGSGLGLFISQGIVEQHGGKVRAESEGPGRGARFTVELPTRAPAA